MGSPFGWWSSSEGGEGPGSEGRPREGGPVAEDGDEPGEVLQLQAVVERVAEAVSPVEERERDEGEEVEAGEGMPDEGAQRLVAGRPEPAGGKREPREEEVHRQEERR